MLLQQSQTTLADIFGHRYQLSVSSYGRPSAGIPRHFTDVESATQFLRSLRASPETWRRLLASIGEPSTTHNDTSTLRACAALASRGRIRIYPVPQTNNAYAITAEPGWAYAFASADQPVADFPGELISVTDAADAEVLVSRLSPSTSWGNILYKAGLQNRISADAPAANRGQVIQALAEQKLIVYKTRHQSGPIATSSGESAPAAGPGVRPVPLAPESASRTAQKTGLPKPAKSLDEAQSRLLNARPAVLAAKKAGKPLPPSPFTLEDKKAIVEAGLEETITVRVIESKHAGDDGWIGRPTDAGHSYSFSAPLSLVEHGDTDPEALLNAFGTRFDSTKDYTILLMDLKKMEEVGDVVPIIPTYENLYDLVEENPRLTRADVETVRATLNDDFAPKYKEFADAISKSSIDQRNEDRLVEFAIDKGFSEAEAKALVQRHSIAQDISTWEIFTGNGMTLDTNAKGGAEYGPVEAFTFDKNPLKLGDLEKQDAVKRLPASYS